MIVIHGDNQILSRQFLLGIRKKAVEDGSQIVELKGASCTMADIVSAVQSISLFGPSNFVIIEEFFSRRTGSEKTSISTYLIQHPLDQIALWESKDVSTQVKSFPPSVVKRFDLPKYLFKFMEDLQPETFRLSLDSAAPEQVLALLLRHVRNLMYIKSGGTNLPSWQAGKLKAQASRFSLTKLQSMYLSLMHMDYRHKTSAAPFDLASDIEVWLIRQVR